MTATPKAESPPTPQVRHLPGRKVIASARFRRDIKRMQKRGKDMDKLKALVDLLVAEQPLPASYKAHPLKGAWKPHWDAHIEPDWLLIYSIEEGCLYLVRTGSHADLFEE